MYWQAQLRGVESRVVTSLLFVAKLLLRKHTSLLLYSFTPPFRHFPFIYILKHNPGFESVQWQTHADECNPMVWEEFWICVAYFLQHANELDFDGRLNKHNHTPLFSYLVTLIGDCFRVGSTGGTINDVLFQPKYQDKVYKSLLLIDKLGQYRWVGGLACGVRSDMRILRELGPQLKDLKPGGVILLDGGFPGRKHGIIPFPKPKNGEHERWQA